MANETIHNMTVSAELAKHAGTGNSLLDMGHVRENAYFAARDRELIANLRAKNKKD